MLDYAIHVAVIVAVVLSLISGRAAFAALLLFVNVGINQLLFIENPSWSEATQWAALFAVKDLLLLTLFGFRKNTAEFILLLSFAASCLFHQAILAQILTYESENLTLFAIRPTVMKYLTVAQLATVFYIILGGGDSGGKRVKSWLHGADIKLNSIFRFATHKAFK